MNKAVMRVVVLLLALASLANPANAISYTAKILHPAGFTSSGAGGVSDFSQVGYGTVSVAEDHALLWNGSATSVVDLHPVGFLRTYANGASGDMQVGLGLARETSPPFRIHTHALLWTGTAASVVDLHPLDPNFTYSEAHAISGG